MIRLASKNDLKSIRYIMNEAILHSTAIYDYYERDDTWMETWWETKQEGNWPIKVVEINHEIVGFGTYGPFRPHHGFVHTVEHSLYLLPQAQGKGLGKKMLLDLIASAKMQQFHVMIGCIDGDNTKSIALHEKCGFRVSGTLKEAGRKFDRWLDLIVMDIHLSSN